MDTELQAEQAYVDDAYGWLEWMRARALGLVAATDPKELDLLHALRRRAAMLTDGGRPLCFGRIDLAEGGSFHIGRRHVEDAVGDPVVIEWRAPVAVSFYRANPAVPMGLTRRRQFVIDGRNIQSMADDVFDSSGGMVPRLRGGDVLLAELSRGRGPEMLDIVATIQAEQDEVIRAPLDGVLVVQGGPGSGKTAVGLHRAAFLLYGNDTLARQGVLVLGPNRVFLRYIAQVLPSLGEEAVVQTTVRDLAAGIRVVAEDDPHAERVKGDERMAAVIKQALAAGRRPVTNDLIIEVGLRRLVLAASKVNDLAEDVASRRLAYETARAVLRDALVDAFEVDPLQVRSSPAFGAAVDRLWPAVSPPALVRSLVGSKAALGRAARGILSAAEQALVLRPATAVESLEIRDAAIPPPAWEVRRASAGRGAVARAASRARRRDPWTAADVALLDEALFVVTGECSTYGHIVVDEAQDLSPMQLRMVARRSPRGSVTLLGDLAQATGAWAPSTWDEVLSSLRTPQGSRVSELRLGYRSPADVIELASRILPFAAPNVVPPSAVRESQGAVTIVPDLDVVAAVTALRYNSIAVIGVFLPDVAAALTAAGIDWGWADAGGLSRRVALVEARQAKGLEFDAVVVVEPAAIVASAPDPRAGLRLLYVALTRPTQALTVLHAQPLPAALAAPVS